MADLLSSLPIHLDPAYPNGVELVDAGGVNKASISADGAVKVSYDPAATQTVAISGQNYDGFGNLEVNINAPLPAGSNIIGEVGINPALNGVQLSAGPGLSSIDPIYVQTAEVSGGTGTISSNPQFVELVAGSAPIGSVEVSNTVAVSGSISVDNFPADQ